MSAPRLRLATLVCLLLAAFAKTGDAQAVSDAEFAAWATRNQYQPGRDWRSYLEVAPGNMGPNALPIAPGNYGYVDSVASFGVSLSGHARTGDRTADLTLAGAYPFGERASLRVRYLLREWYELGEALALERNSLAAPGRGGIDGDVHVEALFQVLQQAARRPDVTLAVRVKTASGSGLEALRFTDSPGYQFDATVAHSCRTRVPGLRLRPFASVGFFVWQRFGRGAPQNDAYTYALGLQAHTDRLRGAVELAGYTGWTKRLDRPVALRGELHLLSRSGRWTGVIGLGQGLRDLTYTTLRLGAELRLQRRAR